MNHVHWWLFGLSFAMGLVLTLGLLGGPVKREVPLEVPVDNSVIPDPPTTRIVTESPTKKIPVPPPAPYGPGSAQATPDGRGPAGWLVKARSDTRLYYTPDNPTYDPTVAEAWFKDEDSALRAGFMPWHNNSRN
jgi:uncharacterized membrane protein ArfC